MKDVDLLHFACGAFLDLLRVRGTLIIGRVAIDLHSALENEAYYDNSS